MKIFYKSYILGILVWVSVLFCTGQDTLNINNLGHASLMFEYNDLIIHVDPRSSEADYTSLPKADMVFVTHGHGDHYDVTALNNIKKESTLLITTQDVYNNKGSYTGTIEVMNNGDSTVYSGIPVKAVPAYNYSTSHHPKGVGNGYVFFFGNTKVYVAGDTEDVEEMADIDANIAFIPMNQPYTMLPDQAANAALMINPDVLHIYHYDTKYVDSLITLLKDHPEIEIRVGEDDYKVLNGKPVTTAIININKSEFYAFPNPVEDFLYLSNIKDYNLITLIGVRGNVIKTIGISSNDLIINTNDLIPGYYILKANQKNKEQTFNFIKK